MFIVILKKLAKHAFDFTITTNAIILRLKKTLFNMLYAYVGKNIIVIFKKKKQKMNRNQNLIHIRMLEKTLYIRILCK